MVRCIIFQRRKLSCCGVLAGGIQMSCHVNSKNVLKRPLFNAILAATSISTCIFFNQRFIKVSMTIIMLPVKPNIIRKYIAKKRNHNFFKIFSNFFFRLFEFHDKFFSRNDSWFVVLNIMIDDSLRLNHSMKLVNAVKKRVPKKLAQIFRQIASKRLFFERLNCKINFCLVKISVDRFWNKKLAFILWSRYTN